MLRFKKVFAIIGASIFTLAITACSASTKTEGSSKQALNFGAMSSIDVVPMIIAEEKGYFKDEGLEFNLQTFKSAKDRDAAFQAGSLDGIIGDEVAICLYQNADFDAKITGITDGDFMLVAGADSGVKSVADLKGKSVAISEKTAIEYTLDKILENNSMKPEDVSKAAVPAMPTRLEMLRNNNVAAALLPEPFSSLAINDGGILLGNASTLAGYPSITAFTQKAIDGKGDEIKAFYRAYNKAVDYINSNPISEYEDTIIRTVGFPDDMKGKITLPEFRKNALPSEAEVKSAIDWVTSNGLITKTLTPADMLSDIGVK
ncbi:ABC transporter substrate-binding protein [Clostridium thermarum]|uniref:ABC transporter substrate-binding protein n=1 Tax=Clostridium thermarum TaxID=1716543 RepID=UPI00111ED227|nr:MetQ/NlpA family ABC transporter substrate-binding protein [Clostridium thermarum]